MMKVYIENNKINFVDQNIDKLGYTDYTDELWEQINSRTWHATKNSKGQYKYIQSSDKSLHQLVFDYYFGEEVRKKAYQEHYIIEHLDNDGFNCEISNLFLLLDIKNTYKGWYFDKKAIDSLPIVALSIFHILENRTFQITIAFNGMFKSFTSGKYIQDLKLLYDYDYCIVLQDAESILEDITKTKSFSIEQFRQRYRFKDYRIRECLDIGLTDEEEKQLPSGSLIYKDGEAYIIDKGEFEKFHMVKSIYDKNWS